MQNLAIGTSCVRVPYLTQYCDVPVVDEHRIGVGILTRRVISVLTFLTFVSDSPEKYIPPLHRNRPFRPIQGQSERVEQDRVERNGQEWCCGQQSRTQTRC